MVKKISFIALSQIFLLFSILMNQSFAEGKHDVPRKLFGIELGGVYDIGEPENNNTGDMPVKKVCSVYKFLGSGFHYNYQPLSEYEDFEYREKKDKLINNVTESSFSAYILPIIHDNINTEEKLKNEKIKYEVISISWSHAKTEEYDLYFWAKDMCDIFLEDIKVKPEIFDDYENKLFKCSFREKEREFNIDSMTRSINLRFIKDIFDQKNKITEKKLLKIVANKIRPYE